MSLVLLAAAAHAQVEVCAGPLSVAEWHEQMDVVDAALGALDGARADVVLDDLVYELRCLAEPAPPAAVGRLARQIALVAFFAQDPDELHYWGLLARETAGAAPWPDGVPVPERFLELVARIPPPPYDRVEGGLLVPKGGGVLLDGFLLREPVASRGAQHLLQLADKKGGILWTRWQTGAAFPEDVLTDEPGLAEIPRWYVPPPAPEPLPEPDGVAAAPEPEPPPDADAAVRAPGEPTLQFDEVAWPDCPWQGTPSAVEVSGRTVAIAGEAYRVKTDAEVAAFRRVLRSCGEFRASRRLVRWQEARGNPFAGARAHRDAMVEALLTAEPKGRRRR